MLRQVSRSARVVLRYGTAGRQAVRLNSTSAGAVDPKIAQIVEQISTLTLLETSALIGELKTRLNIPDIAMAVGGAAAPAAPAAPEAAAEEEVKEEKTIFAVKLEAFDAKSKPKVIKEVKNLLGLSLVEAKKFVEAAPKVLRENVAKEEAEKVKASLEALGAKVVLE
ncbi:AFL089Cp [Eremothecium gossypii ATCC 10895]|uniref:AFL089Cp n=1 Tax=Eremothecium gossypii (strain ATCC 10895 / CBS 109.51 / FGSC 9923 / NRRL Y-1056) TaxID=284811 RepID=Q755B4_EREGS|nr:putative mitochondrial 54S ribosomal protein MNP1 [Eremothecium gossypii ATCC 10895]AAS53283.1 AFL089Cp [Eremothecium gossypii ATCC 10895]AEY97593.1 FAFL089Cp [Eremothecium gossypii FDAG1]